MSTLPPPPAQVSLVLSSLRLSCPSSIRLTIAPAACLSHRNGRSSLKPIHPRLLALSPHSPIPVDFTGHRTLRFALLGFRRTAQPVRPASRIPGTSSLYRRRSRYFTPASSPVFRTSASRSGKAGLRTADGHIRRLPRKHPCGSRRKADPVPWDHRSVSGFMWLRRRSQVYLRRCRS